MMHYLGCILEHEKSDHVQASVNRNWKLWKINPFVLKSFQAIIHSYRKVYPKVMLPLFHNPRTQQGSDMTSFNSCSSEQMIQTTQAFHYKACEQAGSLV